MTRQHLDTAAHPLDDASYVAECRRQLDAAGDLVLFRGRRAPESEAARAVLDLAAGSFSEEQYAEWLRSHT